MLYLIIRQRIESPTHDLWVIRFYLSNNAPALMRAFNDLLSSIIGICNALNKASHLKVIDEKHYRVLVNAEAPRQQSLLQVIFAGS